jgi:outer membrane receptor protein involved in Fe transport
MRLGTASFLRLTFFLLFLHVAIPITLFAQSTGSVTGRIVCNSSPVEFASVIFYQSLDTTKIFRVTTTDSTGWFSMKDLPQNRYIMKIQMLGYLTVRKSFIIDDPGQERTFNNIELQTDIKTLNSVEIVAQKNILKKTPTGFIINTSQDISQATGTATDLLRNTPTVVVDEEGVITLRGKTPMILVNGRNSVLSNTDRIPASSVESIEIINNPSAKYDAEAESGIINIRLKKNSNLGTNGSIALGGGYGARGRVSGAFIINHQAGKWNLGLSYDNRFAGRTRNAVAERINFNLPDEYDLTQQRHDDRNEGTQNLKLDVDFTPDKRNSFNLEVLGNFNSQHNYETLVSMFEKQNGEFNYKDSRYSDELGKEKAIEAALNYNRKFSDKRQTLSASLSSSFNFDDENTTITTQSLDSTDNPIGEPLIQQTYDYQNSNLSNLTVDYDQPLGKKAMLETGYKGTLRITDVDFQTSYMRNSEYEPDPKASNIFKFNEDINAVYLIYKNFTGPADSARFRYDIGLRVEQTWNKGHTASNDSSFTNSYVNFFPSVNLSYAFRKAGSVKITFTRRINRPRLGQLNPFIDITDSLNPHGGNPYLKPELVNSLEIGYAMEWKNYSTVSNVYYRYSTNIIRPYISLDTNGVALVIPVNYGDAVIYGFEEIFSAFPLKWWNFNLSFSIYRQIINGSNVNIEAQNDLVSWYGKLINNFTLWKGSTLQFILNYNSPIATPQGTRIGNWYVDGGFRQKFFKGKAAVGLVVTDIFNTLKSGITASSSEFDYHRTFKVDTRAVMLTLTWSFRTAAKEELLENKFSNE